MRSLYNEISNLKKLMKYIVISSTGVFNTTWLLFPDWSQVSAIIDLPCNKFIQSDNWQNENDSPQWQTIEEDHL